MKNHYLIALISVLFSFSACADQASEKPVKDIVGSTELKAEDSDIAFVRTELVKIIPQMSGAEILATDVKNIYRIMLEGTYAFVYIVGDKILLGDLFDSKKNVNLSEQAGSQGMVDAIKSVPTKNMIVFGPDKPARTITVFTDIDCGYCRKLHSEIGELNAAGIQVRYLSFPRSGIGAESYNKFVSVWCNKDQQGALTKAKSDIEIPVATCENPIAENYELGVKVGVRGTPTIIYDDGSVVPGYVPAEQLIERLGLNKG